MKNIFYLCLIIIISINLLQPAYSQNVLTHQIGLNAGYTIVFNKYSNVNLGLNYELKKIEGKLGIGVFGNYILGDNQELLFGFPIIMHDAFGVKSLVLSVAPGMATTKSIDYLTSKQTQADTSIFLQDNPTRTNFLLRIAAEWEFKLPDEKSYTYTVNPYISTDIIAFNRTYLTLGIKFNYVLY